MNMKNKLLKNIIVATIVATSTITLNPLQNKGIQVVEAKSKIKLNTTKKTIYKGSTYTLKVKGTKKKVKWTTSNKKVATVNSKGKVTAKKKGTATITAKVGGKKLKCKITVKNPVKKNKNITVKQAIEKVKKVFGKKLYYFCNGEIIKHKGKKYYVVYVKNRVDGHYSTITQYLVSTDGSVCKEGWYYSPNNIGFY